MATAPELAQEAPQDDTPVDFAAEAAKMGWKPVEDFKGDPAHHVDAETFYKRGQEMMPILKAQNKALMKRLDMAEKAAKQAAEFFSQAEQRAYQRAVADIRAEQEAAVESGDVEAHRKAAEKLDKLEKPKTNDNVEARSEEDRAEDFADWGKVNKWYADNAVMQAYADAQAAKIAKTKNGFLDREDLDAVTEKVREKFSDDFPEAFGAKATPRPRNPVEGVSRQTGGRPGKTAADLPDGGAQMRRFIKAGLIKSEADYLKTYEW